MQLEFFLALSSGVLYVYSTWVSSSWTHFWQYHEWTSVVFFIGCNPHNFGYEFSVTNGVRQQDKELFGKLNDQLIMWILCRYNTTTPYNWVTRAQNYVSVAFVVDYILRVYRYAVYVQFTKTFLFSSLLKYTSTSYAFMSSLHRCSSTCIYNWS